MSLQSRSIGVMSAVLGGMLIPQTSASAALARAIDCISSSHTATVTGSGGGFGSVVAVSGNTAVVGHFRHGGTGAAFVYVREGGSWQLQATLLASDAAAGDQFGVSVAIAGDTILVGANLESTPGDGASGAAYVFARSGNTWTQQAKLLPSGPFHRDNFGMQVALDGDTAVVSSVGDTPPEHSPVGAAYVFVRTGSTWTQQARLVGDDTVSGDNFGSAVSVHGDTVVVGAFVADGAWGLQNCGAVYVYVRKGTTWMQTAKLVAADAAANDQFGFAVAVHDDAIVVSAIRDDENTIDTGSVYIFTLAEGAWSQTAKLVLPDGAYLDNFGWSVSLDADRLAVGAALRDSREGLNTGSTMVYGRTGATWSLLGRLAAPSPRGGEGFGTGVAMSGSTVVIGAPGSGGPSEAGSAYMLDLTSAAPAILDGPHSATACPGQLVMLTVQGDSPALSYQWRKDGKPLVDGDSIAGSSSAKLIIGSLSTADVGAYDVVVSTECGIAVSEPAIVALSGTGCCVADWNRDGVVNSTDVSAFINDWFGDMALGCGR